NARRGDTKPPIFGHYRYGATRRVFARNECRIARRTHVSAPTNGIRCLYDDAHNARRGDTKPPIFGYYRYGATRRVSAAMNAALQYKKAPLPFWEKGWGEENQ
ncbi:MAG: hypothetical protein SH847_00965, partial [Roseiflexaceae bacterium]|nr:hypothetical protein [Roseiflexaceae bacterium]